MENARLRAENEKLQAGMRAAEQPPDAISPVPSRDAGPTPFQSATLNGKYIKLTQNGDDQVIEFSGDHLCIYSDCITYSRQDNTIWVTFPHSESGRRIMMEGDSLVVSGSPGTWISGATLDGTYFKEGAPKVDYLHHSLTISGGSPTVRSNGSGLEWMRCAIGQDWDGTTCAGEPTPMAWSVAKRLYGQGFTAFGRNDWRMPSAADYKVYVSQDHPLITSSAAFPSNPNGPFWTTSENSNVWGQHFVSSLQFQDCKDYSLAFPTAICYPNWEVKEELHQYMGGKEIDGYVRLVRADVPHVPHPLTKPIRKGQESPATQRPPGSSSNPKPPRGYGSLED